MKIDHTICEWKNMIHRIKVFSLCFTFDYFWYNSSSIICFESIVVHWHLINKYYNNLYWINFCNKEFLPFGYFRMTKCTFHKYGTSGNIENHDVLCILPLNIGNIHPMKILSHIFFSQWKNLYLHLVLVSGAWFTLLPCHPLQVQRHS